MRALYRFAELLEGGGMNEPTPTAVSDYIGRHWADCPDAAAGCEHIWCYVCRFWFAPDDVPCQHASRYPSARFAEWSRRRARQKADRAEMKILRAKGLPKRHAAKLARKDAA